MTSQLRKFVVPESGTYHFVTGIDPHLIAECTDACQPPVTAVTTTVEIGNVVTVDFDPVSLSVAMNSGAPLKTEDLSAIETRWRQDDAVERKSVGEAGRPLSFETLIERSEKHLNDSLRAGAWGATYVRLRVEGCVHEWHQVGPLTGLDDAIDCTKCGLWVLDGYRPYFPKREEQEPTP